MTPPLVYSVAEAAEVLGVSDSLVYRLINDGELPSVRLGDRRLVVPHRSLEAWLIAQAGVEVPEPPVPPVLVEDEAEDRRWNS